MPRTRELWWEDVLRLAEVSEQPRIRVRYRCTRCDVSGVLNRPGELCCWSCDQSDALVRGT